MAKHFDKIEDIPGTFESILDVNKLKYINRVIP